MAKENSMEPFVVDFSGKVLDCHQADSLDEELIEEIRDRAKKGCELFVFIDTGYSANLDKPFLASDHLNLTGNNPLVGPNNEIGARFPVINDAYAFADGLLAAGAGKLTNCDSLAKLETRVGAGLKPGVVPSDEEIALINSLGADFYCYNLVPATLVAAHAGKSLCPDHAAKNETDTEIRLDLGEEELKLQGLKDSVIENAIEVISAEVSRPLVAIVLGSGVTACNNLYEEKSFDYEKLFGIAPTVHGHTGSLTIGKLQNMETAPTVAVFRGRFHLYEGHGWLTVTLLARLVAGWKIPNFVITNAAGGLNREYSVGDLMVIESYRDHLNPEFQETGLLPALKNKPVASTNDLTRKIIEVGQSLARDDKDFRPLRTGCYAALLGPSYETHAEIEMLRRLKADAVGMSTAPELETVKNTDTTAAGISVITNVWNENVEMGGHEEVLQESKAASLRLDKLLMRVIQKL